MRAIRYQKNYESDSKVLRELCIYVPTCKAMFVLNAVGILSVSSMNRELGLEVDVVNRSIEEKVNEKTYDGVILRDFEKIEIPNNKYGDLIWCVGVRPHEITYSKHRKNLEGILSFQTPVLQR